MDVDRPEILDSAELDSARRGRRRWITAAVAGLVIVVIGFAVFRPDKLVTDQRVDEQLDAAVAAVVSEPSTADAAPDATAPSPAPSVAPSTVPGVPAPPPVQEVSRGTFTGQAGHRVEGTAVVVNRPEGRLLVLPDLDAENGPDLQLYLSPRSDGSVDGGLYLQPLKGNQGTQTYELPPSADLGVLANVVIWCERFSVPFATASLTS